MTIECTCPSKKVKPFIYLDSHDDVHITCEKHFIKTLVMFHGYFAEGTYRVIDNHDNNQ